MKPKTATVLYRVFTLPFAAFMLFGGYAELSHSPEGEAIMRHLGYPLHVLDVLGVAKLLGALALLQPWLRTAKEWAYAGFTFNLIGACVARAAAGDSLMLIVSPLLFLTWMAFSYLFWKKRQAQRLAPAESPVEGYPAPLSAVAV
jgi:DoxX-like family